MTLFEQLGGTYRQVGDYQIPNLTVPEEVSGVLGKYALLRKITIEPMFIYSITGKPISNRAGRIGNRAETLSNYGIVAPFCRS